MRLNLLITKWTSIADASEITLCALLSERMQAPPRRRLQLRKLEQRVMMSIAPESVKVPAGGGYASQSKLIAMGEQGTATASGIDLGNNFVTVWAGETDDGAPDAAVASRETVFVDTGAESYEQLVADLINNADSSRDFDVFLLDGQRDGIEQITAVLAQYSDVDAIHIVSHGDDGEMTLGNVTLREKNLVGYAGAIAGWGSSLSDGAELLLHGCDTALSASGQTLVRALSALTGADVTSSVDDTRHAILAAKGDLENSIWQFETDAAFSLEIPQNCGYILNVAVDLERVNNTGAAIMSSYDVVATANDFATDHSTLSGGVVLAAEARTAAIDVTGIADDGLLENDEAVTVTNGTGTSCWCLGFSRLLPSTERLKAEHQRLPNTHAPEFVPFTTVTVIANDANASETASDIGQFTVDLGTVNNTGAAITSSYDVVATATDFATDHSTLSGSVVIAAEARTAAIDVTGIVDDGLLKNDEAVTVTNGTGTSCWCPGFSRLLPSTERLKAEHQRLPNTHAPEFVPFTTVTVIANDANASETASDLGQFTVDLGTVNNTGAAITSSYDVVATATDFATDHSTLSGSVVIATEARTAAIDVTGIVDNGLLERSDTVVVSPASTDDASVTVDSASSIIVILDNDTTEAQTAFVDHFIDGVLEDEEPSAEQTATLQFTEMPIGTFLRFERGSEQLARKVQRTPLENLEPIETTNVLRGSMGRAMIGNNSFHAID